MKITLHYCSNTWIIKIIAVRVANNSETWKKERRKLPIIFVYLRMSQGKYITDKTGDKFSLPLK